jgi:HEAT repeat protein
MFKAFAKLSVAPVLKSLLARCAKISLMWNTKERGTMTEKTEKKSGKKPKKAKISFSESLEKLADAAQPFPISAMYAFSNLEQENADKLAATWHKLEDKRREKVAADLADLAEEDVELEFNEVFYILLNDKDPKVRGIAIDALWEDESRPLLGDLLKIMESDPSNFVREKAAVAVGRFALLAELKKLPERWTEKIRTGLLALTDAAVPELQRRAIEGLGYFGNDPEIQALIGTAFQSEEEAVKSGAIRAMGRNVDKRWLPEIGKELSNRDPALRYEAVMAAGELGAEELLNIVVERTQDPDREVQFAAVWALGQIGGADAKRALSELIRSNNEILSVAAREALRELELENLSSVII